MKSPETAPFFVLHVLATLAFADAQTYVSTLWSINSSHTVIVDAAWTGTGVKIEAHNVTLRNVTVNTNYVTVSGSLTCFNCTLLSSSLDFQIDARVTLHNSNYIVQHTNLASGCVLELTSVIALCVQD